MCGDWSAIPVASGSIQCVVGDGCFTLLDYPRGYERVFLEIHRILGPGGSLAVRYFCRPTESESLSRIEEDLMCRRIGNAHVLKWRLAMALHGSVREGVPAVQIWQKFNELVPKREKLELHLGWDRREIDTFDVFRGSPAIFTFPTLDEVKEVADPMFCEISHHIPTYELGSCCPTLTYRRL
jgi:SAM-dependent methyltransferase